MLISCEGIVLKSFNYSEADLMLMVFTDKLGKISIYSKNAKKLKSKIGQCSQVMCYSKLNLDCSIGMYKLHSGEVVDNFYNVSSDMDRYYTAFYIIDLVNKLLPENQGNIRAFKLTASALRILKEDCDIELIKVIYRLKLLKYLGVKPEVQKCLVCGKFLEEDFLFNFDESGCICSSCNKKRTFNSVQFDMTTFMLMSFIFENDFEKCIKAKVSKVIIKEVNNLLDKYYGMHFE